QANRLDKEETAIELGRALSGSQKGVDPTQNEALLQKGFWLDGFLRDSELVLVHDRQLWNVLDHWVIGLGESAFHEIMPLLRRTFTAFSESAKNVLSRRSAGRPVKANDLIVQVGQDGNPADGVFDYLEKILT
ncbi:MAG: DUF5682 family protein, partial [Anaerolineae bacterium]